MAPVTLTFTSTLSPTSALPPNLNPKPNPNPRPLPNPEPRTPNPELLLPTLPLITPHQGEMAAGGKATAGSAEGGGATCEDWNAMTLKVSLMLTLI